jgi:hypothetical protein
VPAVVLVVGASLATLSRDPVPAVRSSSVLVPSPAVPVSVPVSISVPVSVPVSISVPAVGLVVGAGSVSVSTPMPTVDLVVGCRLAVPAVRSGGGAQC